MCDQDHAPPAPLPRARLGLLHPLEPVVQVGRGVRGPCARSGRCFPPAASPWRFAPTLPSCARHVRGVPRVPHVRGGTVGTPPANRVGGETPGDHRRARKCVYHQVHINARVGQLGARMNLFVVRAYERDSIVSTCTVPCMCSRVCVNMRASKL